MRLRTLFIVCMFAALVQAQTADHSAVGGKSLGSGYTRLGTGTYVPPITFSGDISGDASSQQVIGILNHPLPALTAGYIHWNGTAWVFDTPASGGSMTWPSGSAGIPNYTGSSAWGTTYNASNLIPANFISTLNQSTTGNAATATAFATIPTNCSPNFYPSGISSTGNAQNCTAVSTINAATAAAIATNGTANQVWGMNGAGSAQGWQTVTSGGSGTVSSGTANQIAWYAATGATVSGNSRLTDSGTTLTYSGAGHVTGNFTIDGTLSVAGPWFVNTVWPASPMGSGSSSSTSNIGISNDGNFYIAVGTGAPSMICTPANNQCPTGPAQVFPSGAGIPNYSGSSTYGTSYSATNKIPATFISTLNQSTTGNAATATNISTSGTANQRWGMDSTGSTQGWQSSPYEIAITYGGLFPSSQVFIRKPTSVVYTIPSGCTNSVVVLGTATTASLTITLLKNGTSFGTAVIAAGTTGGPTNTTWTCSSSTTFSFVAGTSSDVLTVSAPSSADTTAKDLGASIYATR